METGSLFIRSNHYYFLCTTTYAALPLDMGSKAHKERRREEDIIIVREDCFSFTPSVSKYTEIVDF